MKLTANSYQFALRLRCSCRLWFRCLRGGCGRGFMSNTLRFTTVRSRLPKSRESPADRRCLLAGMPPFVFLQQAAFAHVDSSRFRHQIIGVFNRAVSSSVMAGTASDQAEKIALAPLNFGALQRNCRQALQDSYGKLHSEL